MLRLIAQKLVSASMGFSSVGFLGYLGYKFRSAIGVRGEVVVTIGGEKICVRYCTPDLGIAIDSLMREFQALAGLLPKTFNGLIVDAGGYIGTAAIALARLYPDATIVTIEPSRENFRLLLKNVGSIKSIHPLNAALGTKSGEILTLSDRGTGNCGYTVIASPQDNSAPRVLEDVETVTISDIFAKFEDRRAGLIKIDIEGAEKDLFSSAAHDLEKFPVLFVELHDRIVADCTKSFEEFSSRRWVVRTGGEKFLSLSRPVLTQTTMS